MPKQPAPPDRPQAGSGRGGAAPGVLIDDLAAERNCPPLPPEPVFTIDLVEAEAGKRGRRYVAELEEHASRNARAAAEARRIALEQRSHLEEAARGRRTAEREISKLQRELRTALAEQQRLAAQRTKPRRDGTPTAETPPAAAEPRGGAARSELTRTRETVEQQQRLLHERREQLVHALRERDEARIETRRVADARDRAERQLARATEILQHNALEESARIAATTQSPNDAVGVEERTAEENWAARSELEVQVLHLTQEIERLSTRAVELDDALTRETSRADVAEGRFAELVIDAEAADRDAATARQELAAALARDTTALVTIAELTDRIADIDATAAAATSERNAATARATELAGQLATMVEEREATSARVQDLESLLATSTEERATLGSQLADLERTVNAREAGATNAALQVDELTHRLSDLEAATSTTASERDAASAHAAELEQQLTATADDRDFASARVEHLEALLAAAAEERETHRAQMADIEAHATATASDRDGASARAAELEQQLLVIADARDEAWSRAHQLEAVVTEATQERETLRAQLAELGSAATTTASDLEAALARVAELEEVLASPVDDGPDDETIAYVNELRTRLARAEHDAAAAAARVTELTRAAADVEVQRTGVEEARAADRVAADAELERLRDRVAELEQLLLVVESTPVTTSTRSLALEELGQLAASEPVHEPVPAPSPRAVRVSSGATDGDGQPVEPGELRRSLLADLSDLAHQPVSRNDG